MFPLNGRKYFLIIGVGLVKDGWGKEKEGMRKEQGRSQRK